VRQVIKLPADLKRALAIEAAERSTEGHRVTVSDIIIEALHNRLRLVCKREGHGNPAKD
jgi:hypothetical protein